MAAEEHSVTDDHQLIQWSPRPFTLESRMQFFLTEIGVFINQSSTLLAGEIAISFDKTEQ